jgi:hypothetical protein
MTNTSDPVANMAAALAYYRSRYDLAPWQEGRPR